jgi:hypothetical protein
MAPNTNEDSKSLNGQPSTKTKKYYYLLVIITLVGLSLIQDYIVLILILGIEALLIKIIFNNIKIFYKVKDIPVSKIHAASQGLVALKGTLTPPINSPILSPISQEPCVFWEVAIREKLKPRSQTKTPAKEHVIGIETDFLKLTDATGTCYVFYKQADWDIPEKNYTMIGHELNKIKFGQQRVKLSASRLFEVVEKWVPQENKTFVLGDFSSIASNRNPLENTWMHRAKRNYTSQSLWYKMADYSLKFAKTEMDRLVKVWQTEMKLLEGIAPDEELLGTKMVHLISRSDDWLRPTPMFISCYSSQDIPKRIVNNLRKSVLFLAIYTGVAISICYWIYPQFFTFLK